MGDSTVLIGKQGCDLSVGKRLNKVHITADDVEGRKQPARYMIRNPFSLE